MGRRVKKGKPWRTAQPRTPKANRPVWENHAEGVRENQLPGKRPRWLDELDERLAWPADQKPDLEVGDRLIVAWHKIRLVAENGERIAHDEPAVWIEITGDGRNKQGQHVFRYVIHGDEPGQYMAPIGHGDYTSSPSQSIDPDCPVLPLRDNGCITERDHNEREIKRLERLKVRHLEQLSQTDQPGTRARITASINDLDRQLAALRHRRGEAER